MGGSGFIAGLVPMSETLALCDISGHVATSEQLNAIIFKMAFIQGERMLCTPLRARKKYREMVVQLCQLFRRGGALWNRLVKPINPAASSG